MQKNLAVSLLVMFLCTQFVFTPGCCSIFTSAPQKVTVSSNPPSATVKMGPYRGVTPYVVCMPRGKDYAIVVEYNGKTDAQTLEKHIEPIYWINILFWPGLIIDLATGSMFKYDPTDYEFDFTKPSAAVTPVDHPAAIAPVAIASVPAPAAVTSTAAAPAVDREAIKNLYSQAQKNGNSSNN